MKLAIELAMMVRMTKQVIVAVSDNTDDKDESSMARLMDAVYAADEGEGFTLDDSWGCEPATHELVKPYALLEHEDADFVAKPEGWDWDVRKV